MKTWKGWTEKEDRQLEGLRMQGATVGEIALQLERTTNSIKQRLSDLDLRRPSRDVRWLALLSQPHTLQEVAGQMGVLLGTVKKAKGRLRRAGFAIPAATRRAAHA